MQHVTVEIEVAKETHEATVEAVGFMDDVRRVAADELDWTDAPQIAVPVMGRLITAMRGIKKVPREFKQDPAGAALAILVPLLPALSRLVGLQK